MLEQGMAAAELPLLDQSLPDDSDTDESAAAEKADDIAKFEFNEDPDVVFAEEKEGWSGYVNIHCS